MGVQIKTNEIVFPFSTKLRAHLGINILKGKFMVSECRLCIDKSHTDRAHRSTAARDTVFPY